MSESHFDALVEEEKKKVFSSWKAETAKEEESSKTVSEEIHWWKHLNKDEMEACFKAFDKDE